jgi:hypothetical protein
MDQEDDNNYFITETFIRIGISLTQNYEEENKKKEEEKAIEQLEKKIREFEDKPKPKLTPSSILFSFFNRQTDLLNESLEIERYYYNKCLLEKLKSNY